MVTQNELRKELARFATKKDLERFATKKDLERFATKEDFERFATKEELSALREETAAGFADLRRYMEVLYEDLKGTLQTVLDTIIGRLDRRDVAVDQRLDGHERRLTSVEGRVTSLEHRRQ